LGLGYAVSGCWRPGDCEEPPDTWRRIVIRSPLRADADAVIGAGRGPSGARILLPIKEQFYGDRSGSIADPFEQAWTIATVEKIYSEEIQQRFAAISSRFIKCA